MSLSIVSKGVCRTAANEINQICTADTQNKNAIPSDLSADAMEQVREVAQRALGLKSKRSQHSTAEAQQHAIGSALHKINGNLRGAGVAAGFVVSDVAKGTQAHAAYTQAVYSQQLQVAAPANPISAAHAQVASQPAGAAPPPPPPVLMGPALGGGNTEFNAVE